MHRALTLALAVGVAGALAAALYVRREQRRETDAAELAIDLGRFENEGGLAAAP